MFVSVYTVAVVAVVVVVVAIDLVPSYS